jgi:23S rRNA pseudouridine955/2504/2580 synthase
MFLHAYRLKLTHPATGDTLQFEAPLPADCKRFIAQLAGTAGAGTHEQSQTETKTHGKRAI